VIACLVPARLGSKRIPRKNLRPLAGRPMIAWTIQAAQESGLFGAVHVCTEAAEIAEVAASFGAEPHLVPQELCGDLVPSWKPCAHVAHGLQAGGEPVDAIACLQPTSPLRNAGDIRDGVELLERSGADFVVSATPIDPHYFHWALERHGDGSWKMAFGERYLRERELLPERYRPNGSIKLARLAALEATGSFFGPSLACTVTPEERSVHVGDELEFRLAELLLAERVAAR
jgi:CMP-N-acetylneuraminic acid synthetase